MDQALAQARPIMSGGICCRQTAADNPMAAVYADVVLVAEKGNGDVLFQLTSVRW